MKRRLSASESGIDAGGHGTILNSVSSSNSGNGITTGAAGTIQGSVAYVNGGTGFSLSSDTAYRENLVVGNTATVAGGLDLGANSCDGAASCP